MLSCCGWFLRTLLSPRKECVTGDMVGIRYAGSAMVVGNALSISTSSAALAGDYGGILCFLV
jgi:hypothetical protein